MTSDLPNWTALAAAHRPELVALLRERYEGGSFATSPDEFTADARQAGTDCGTNEAANLLDAAQPWLLKLTETSEHEDPDTGVFEERVTVRYEYRGGVVREVPWLLMVHGMNTTGEWQQHLAFDLAAWQGTAPPSFIVKYGRVTLGAFIGFQRRRLVKKLAKQLTEVATRADAHHAGAVPDVIAHSLGTWLTGHLLLDQLDRPESERLRIGRLILTGCILRPDFPWADLQRAGIVQDVLNHYGTNDVVVPLAHMTVGDSGPSGRRGFDPVPSVPHLRVLNVVAPEHGHSDVLDQDNDAYARYLDVWKPFLTNPIGHAGRGIEVADPPKWWKPLPWPLRRGRAENE